MPGTMAAGEEGRRESWHLKREVNLAHLFTTATACVAVAVFIANQDKRIALLESAMIIQDRAATEYKVEIKADLREIKDDIKQVVRKLK